MKWPSQSKSNTMTQNKVLAYPSSSMLLCSRRISEGQRGRVESLTQGGWAPIALTVYLGTFHPFLYHVLFFPCTCMFVTFMSFMRFWHTCTVWHHHCLLNPLSHYYCHALLNMCPYCYLIHGTKYFRGGTEYFIFSAEIFSRGDKIWGDQIFHDRHMDWTILLDSQRV